MVTINLESIIVMKTIIVVEGIIVIREAKVRGSWRGVPMWAWDLGFNISR